MRIISESYTITETTYKVVIETRHGLLCYDCNEKGDIFNWEGLSEDSKLSLYLARNECCDEEIIPYTQTRKVPAIGKCDCGVIVHLGGFTNTCSGCHADYNWNGSRLAARKYWGEETGEHYTDILMIP